MASTSKLTPAERQKAQRLPAPSLFVGPPSRNASSQSLVPPATAHSPKDGRPGMQRQHSLLNERSNRISTPTSPTSRPESQFANMDLSRISTGESGLRPGLSRAPSKLQQELQQPLHRIVTERRAGVDGGRPAPGTATTAAAANEAKAIPVGDKTEALWASMQNTLEEVELSATYSQHSVFGTDHARALEELRTAQIALAQAWARSEADDDIGIAKLPGTTSESGLSAGALADLDHEEPGKLHDFRSPADVLLADRKQSIHIDGHGSPGNDNPRRPRGDSTASTFSTASTRSYGSKDQHDHGHSTSGLSKSLLEEETEIDIRLARQRRQANDRYFERVSKGVAEVVKRLEGVAVAMKSVEMESREIWRSDSRGEGSLEGSDSVKSEDSGGAKDKR